MLLSCVRPPERCPFGCSSGNCNTHAASNSVDATFNVDVQLPDR
jgi:hypothetical protein